MHVCRRITSSGASGWASGYRTAGGSIATVACYRLVPALSRTFPAGRGRQAAFQLEESFSEGLRRLRAFVRHHGHARAPALYVDAGFRIGLWLVVRRRQYRSGTPHGSPGANARGAARMALVGTPLVRVFNLHDYRRLVRSRRSEPATFGGWYFGRPSRSSRSSRNCRIHLMTTGPRSLLACPLVYRRLNIRRVPVAVTPGPWIADSAASQLSSERCAVCRKCRVSHRIE